MGLEFGLGIIVGLAVALVIGWFAFGWAKWQ